MKDKIIVTNIQKFSVHDGPGIRTIVFFKGCNLSCAWCQNPETWAKEPELIYHENMCIGCGMCEKSCPNHAVTLKKTGLLIDKSKCVRCGTCVNTCFAEALELVGKAMTIDEIMEVVLQDEVFYKSGGGLTLSGGEILVQADGAAQLLKRAKGERLSTVIETSGFGPTEKLKEILKYTDLVLYDIKSMNAEIHKKYIGCDNSIILNNLKVVSESGKKFIIRVPYVPGVNSDDENIRKTGELAKTLGAEMIHLLPFHTVGAEKWEGLFKDYTFKDWDYPTKQELNHSREILEGIGVKVNIGGHGYS